MTRFLWLKDTSKPPSHGNVQVYRFCRVPFGIIASPFLLGATIQCHLKEAGSKYAQSVLQGLYVDNVILSVTSLQEAQEFYTEVKALFDSAAMNLREWACNCEDFVTGIPSRDRADGTTHKVLGMVWDCSTDTLRLPRLSEDQLRSCTTKREVLQAISTLFDPLGLLAPVVLRAKLFLQHLWKENMTWDAQLCDQQLHKWSELATDLIGAVSFGTARRVTLDSPQISSFDLLCFCDASVSAYAAVVYLRSSDSNQPAVKLVFSKSRLAPKKAVSVPRLELLAAVIGVRALSYVAMQLRVPISSRYLWSDSKCVLHWLTSKKQLSVFVSNRVKEITGHTDVIFRYVSSSSNPADIGSRGSPYADLKTCTAWWEGPSWLKLPVDAWPDWNFEELTPSGLEEIASECKGNSILFEAGLSLAPEFSPAPFSIDYTKFSKLSTLLSVTTLCMKFVCMLGHKDQPKGYSEARILWERYVQQKYCRVMKPNVVHQLGIKLDSDGVMRCHGRLHNAELPYDAKFPKFLPAGDHFTKLVVEDCHLRLFHAGVSHTLAQIRLTYWIPHGKATVRKILHACVPCRKHETGPYRLPSMPPLPSCRISQSQPFTYTGLDYFGPLFIARNGESQKVWVCLYTCMAVRAIHLELVLDMSAYEFLLCMRRFIAQRGKPSLIISDNAAQFKLANATLHNAWNNVVSDDSVTSFLSKECIKWNYIPEFSPWMGGFYERLVGLVKRALRKSLGMVSLSLTQLLTLLKEVEAVINTRPLVCLDDDVHVTPLTPAHFLGQSTNVGIPDVSCAPDDEYVPHMYKKMSSKQHLLERWKTGQQHLNSFWKVWSEEYLLSLRERHQRAPSMKQSRVASSPIPSINDIVIVKDNNRPRNAWKMGKIVQLNSSEDKEIRSAKLKLGNGKFITRPIVMLYPIECSAGIDDNDLDDRPSLKRASRKAAEKARKAIQGYIKSGTV